MDDKTQLIIQSLSGFYKNKDNLKTIQLIIEQKHKLSLRILDWFVTNYCKKTKIYITNTNNNPLSKKNLDVYQIYKLKLKAYSKLYMDPFCRKHKIDYYYGEKDYLQTSCGQLCFFKWCIEDNILEYVEKNFDIIEKDMKTNFT
jgi:hypothetical protein